MSEVVLYRFQPDAMDKKTLECLFTGKKRKELLMRLTKEIKAAVKNQTPRYYLIIGSRGVGKTHLITLLYYDVKEQIENVLSVKLSEEEFSLYRVSDLLLRILELIKGKEMDLSNFEQMSEDEVVVAVLEELKSTGKMIVLFLENLNQILGEQMQEREVQWLRSIFQTENNFIMVTTAPLVFPQVSEHEEPFFNFFETIYLDELNRDELKNLVKEIAKIEKDEAFLSNMDEYAKKIDAVYILTGGSPRMAMLLYDLMSKGNVADVEEAFFKLLDENTPYYQDVFRLLSGEKRKVFDTLLEIGPATPKAIAEKARLDNNTVNTLLRRLEKDGYVRSHRMGKTTKYEEKERLFRLWRKLRREPFAKQKLSILIEFLKLWYREEERGKRVLELFKDFKEVLDEKKEREASYWFSSLSMRYKRDLIPQVTEKIYEVEKPKLLDELVYGDRELKTKAFKTEVQILLKKNDYEGLLKKAEEILKVEESDAFAWSIKGISLGILGKYDEAIKCFDEVIKINPNNAEVWFFKGIAMRNLEKYDEAIKCFDEAIKINPNDEAWNNKGIALEYLEKYDEAIKCFDEVIKINPNNAEAWFFKGIALEYLEKYDEAVKCFDEAIKINPNDAEAWNNKGTALRKLGKNNEAVKCYDEAIKINPNDAEAWNNKGIALIELSKYEEALQALSRFIPTNAETWSAKITTLIVLSLVEFNKNNYGNALEKLKSALYALNKTLSNSKNKELVTERMKKILVELFLKGLIEAKNVEALDMALKVIIEEKKELKEFFEPISIAVEIVKSKNVNRYYDFHVERREVVSDIVKKLTGSKELLPREYRS